MKKSLLLLTSLLIIQHSFSQNALSFDGVNDYVQTNYSGISDTGSRTIESWIKVPLTTNSLDRIIVSWGNNLPGEKSTFRIQSTNGTNGALRYEINSGYIVGNTDLRDGLWHHVAVTWQNDNTPNITDAKLYVDGVQETISAQLGWGLNTGSGTNFKIGKGFSTTKPNFLGEIDEVRIWNVARTQTEIASSMNIEFCAAPPSLKAYYKFNSGIAGGSNSTVTTAIDDAGSNNGTLSGFALTGTSSNWVTGKSIFPVSIDSSFAITSCGSYTMPNGTVVTTAGIYYDTISSSATCDSLNSYVITISSSTIQNVVSDSGCVTYTTPIGTMITASGTYYDTVGSSTGCDSLIQYDIIISGAVDDSVYRVGGRMTSFDTWAIHQWVRCDSGFAPITGATGRFYDATLPGDYAVIVTRDYCVDTSDCININPASINENSINNLFEIYPNPASFVLNISNIENRNINSVSIIDITGKLALNKSNIVSKTLNIESLETGVYFLKIETKDGIVTIKFVKN